MGGANLLDIDQTLVHQFLNLISFQPFTSSIFAHAYSFNIEIIDLIQVMVKIKRSKDEKQRKQIYDQIKFNQNIMKVLSTINIDPLDLISMLMILFIDYIDGDVKWILASLKVEGEVHMQTLIGLLDLDFSLDSRTTI